MQCTDIHGRFIGKRQSSWTKRCFCWRFHLFPAAVEHRLWVLFLFYTCSRCPSLAIAECTVIWQFCSRLLLSSLLLLFLSFFFLFFFSIQSRDQRYTHHFVPNKINSSGRQKSVWTSWKRANNHPPIRTMHIICSTWLIWKKNLVRVKNDLNIASNRMRTKIEVNAGNTTTERIIDAYATHSTACMLWIWVHLHLQSNQWSTLTS